MDQTFVTNGVCKYDVVDSTTNVMLAGKQMGDSGENADEDFEKDDENDKEKDKE